MLRFLLQEEDGQGMVEYALILGLISLSAIALLRPMSVRIQEIFSEISNSLK